MLVFWRVRGAGAHQSLADTILAGRRAGSRNYPLAFKREVVKETFEPGRSVAAVALSRGLNANMVFTWRRDPRFRPADVPASHDVEFLPVSVVAKELEASARTVEAERGEIELVLREGHRLLLRGDFDADKVGQLVRCLSYP